jgi:hypothetical protein
VIEGVGSWTSVVLSGGCSHPESPGYFFFLPGFFLVDFFLADFVVTDRLADFFAIDFLPAFFAAFFFFAEPAFAFFFTNPVCLAFFAEADLADFFDCCLLFFFFLADFPNAAAQPSAYFSLDPILKIVMIVSCRWESK